LIHGDYRLDNMFFEAGRMSELATNELERNESFRGSVGEARSMKIIDFQCVKESNGEIDLVSRRHFSVSRMDYPPSPKTAAAVATNPLPGLFLVTKP
jgi:hypothetical protein